VQQGNVDTAIDYNFDPLEAGNKYQIKAIIQNKHTGTEVDYGVVATDIFTIPPVVITSVTIENEYEVTITWTPHDIDTIDQIVTFHAGVDWSSEPPNVDILYVNTTLTQNLYAPTPIVNYEHVFDFDTTEHISYYGTNYIQQIDHTFHIKNFPYEMISECTAGCILLADTISNAFKPPTTPTDVNITYSSTATNYTVTWNPSTYDLGKATTIYYKIYLNGSLYNEYNVNFQGIIPPTYTISTNPISAGSWTVYAYNVYGDCSTSSTAFVVTTPLFETTSISSMYNITTGANKKRFKIAYTASEFNTNYVLTGPNVNDISLTTDESGDIYTPQLTPNTYTFTITLRDSLNKSVVDNAQSINILQPTLMIQPGLTYVLDSERQFYVTISVSGINGGGYLIMEGTPSLTHATYNSFSNNKLYFTFDDNISREHKTCSATIIDNWGYSASASRSDLELDTLEITSITSITYSETPRRFNIAKKLAGTIWSSYSMTGVILTSSTEGYIDIDNAVTSGTHNVIMKSTNSQGFTITSPVKGFTISAIGLDIGSFFITKNTNTYYFNINSVSYNNTCTVSYQLRNATDQNLGSSGSTNTTGQQSGSYASFTDGTTYKIYASVVDGWGFSTSQTLSAILPSRPTLASGDPSDITQTSFSIDFTANSNGSGVFSSYSVSISPNHGSNYISNSTIFFSGLTLNQAYDISITKNYSYSYSSVTSDQKTVTTLNVVNALAPSISSVSAESTTTVSVEWTKHANNDGVPANPFYKVILYDNAKTEIVVNGSQNVGSDITSYTYTGLTAGTTYHFKVQKFTSSNNPISENFSEAVTTYVYPIAVSGLSATPTSDTTRITLSWTNSGTHGTPADTTFVVNYIYGESQTSLIASAMTEAEFEAKSATRELPSYDTTYILKVSKAYGTEPTDYGYGTIVSDHITATTSSAPVQNPIAVNVSDTIIIKPVEVKENETKYDVIISWTINSNGDATVNKFVIIASYVFMGFWYNITKDILNSTATSGTICLSNAFMPYYIKVKKMDSQGINPVSTPAKTINSLYKISSYAARGYNHDGEFAKGTSGIYYADYTHPDNQWLIDEKNLEIFACKHSTFFKLGTSLKACGNNSYGQLGIGSTTNQSIPNSISGVSVSKISCGKWHVLVKTTGSELYAWGYNGDGQLGLGDTANRTSPTALSISNIRDIAAGTSHSLYVDINSKVYGTGDNSQYQLGLGDNTNKQTFTEISDVPSSTLKVYAGNKVSYFVTSSAYYAVGLNNYAQLGRGGDPTSHETDIAEMTVLSAYTISKFMLTNYAVYFITTGNDLYGWGRHAFNVGSYPVSDTAAKSTQIPAKVTNSTVTHASTIISHNLLIWRESNGAIKECGLALQTNSGTINYTTPTDVTPYNDISYGINSLTAFNDAHMLELNINTIP
jgi:alpha-tubulin suppressor-like RCC1 family protein